MLKEAISFLEKWGHYVLALLCAGVILASSFWAGKIRYQGMGNAPAAVDQAQRLAEVTASPPPLDLVRPARGQVMRFFSEKPVYDVTLDLWLFHPYVDFEVQPGEKVYAMMSGEVAIDGDSLSIHNDQGNFCLYRGLSCFSVDHGQQVRAGTQIGEGGGYIPMESDGDCLCVGYFRQGRAVDFLPLLED